MKILDRYVAKNFIIGYVIAFGVLMGLRVVTDLFVHLDEFTENPDMDTAAVIKHMPDTVQEFTLPTGSISGLSTHPKMLIPDLFLSENFYRYFNNEFPEGFFTVAIEGRRMSERLIVMWKKEGKQFYFHEVIGFTLTDVNQGVIGTIESINDSTAQALFIVEGKDGQVLIPMVDDFIRKIDRKNREVVVETPEGLIDINRSLN